MMHTSKRKQTALFLVMMFILTAFTVITPNATVNHIPFPYAQNSPAKPYVATSNGLTYTVEPNGTYLWNGHYLRAPPMPYPKVPTVAPDGLPYGAVGQVGAQGHVGPYSFTRGVNDSSGQWPSAVTGATTTISVDTVWRNATVPIVGNISIDNGITLDIIDSIVTFTEPSGSYAYGINLASSVQGDSIHLNITNGSVLTQTSASDNGFYISDSYGLHIAIANSTIDAVSNSSAYATSIWFLWANNTDFTTYNAATSWGTSYEHGINGCIFHNGKPEIDQTNMILARNNIYDGIAAINVRGVQYGSFYLNDSTVENIVSQASPWTQYDYLKNLYFYNDLFFNINESYFNTISPYWAPSVAEGSLLLQNCTFNRIFTNGSLSSGTTLMGFGDSHPVNFTVIHTSILNIHSDTIPGDVGGITIVGSSAIWSTVEYNLISNAEGQNSTEASLIKVYSSSSVYPTIVAYNKVQNLWANNSVPLSQGGPFSYSDGPAQMVAFESFANTVSDVVEISDNFISNVSGPMGAIKLADRFGGNASDNTFLNIRDNAVGIIVGALSGRKDASVYGNTFYGVYNYSIATGSAGGGSAVGSSYISNTVNDVDVSSFGQMVLRSSGETVSNYSGAIYLLNWYQSFAGVALQPLNSTYSFNGNITSVAIDSSSIDFFNATGWVQSKIGTDPNYGYFRTVVPKDFNITTYNSYLPSTLFSMAANMSDYRGLYPPKTVVGLNPNFLNLTGYLGIYPSQTYTLNASNIKGESSLPVYLAGSQIASIPASSAHYNLTASYSSGTLEYSLSANSASDQPISLMWNGQVPNAAYSVAMYDHGKLINYTNVASSANGVVTFSYNPAAMPLDPTFALVPPPNQPDPNVTSLLTIMAIAIGLGLLVWALTGRRR